MAVKGQKLDKLTVFISYSRQDLLFAEQLVVALEQRGIQCKIDTRDLPSLEDWRRELLGFLQAADAVVFVVTPSSIGSPVCAWEIEQVTGLNKRLAPLLLKRVPDEQIPQIPEAIAKINYLYFDQPNTFESQADKLATALQTDLQWVKEHTRLAELARRWEERKQPKVLLLGGLEIDEAEKWIASRPREAPEPTNSHRELVIASRRAWKLRQRNWIVGSTTAAIIAFALAGAALWQRQVAISNESLAVANEARATEAQRAEAMQRSTAESQRNIAIKNESLAKEQRDRALLNQSRYLTGLARSQLAAGKTTLAGLLAIEALPDQSSGNQRPWLASAENILNSAMIQHRERTLLLRHQSPVSISTFFDQGRRFWTLSRERVTVWDANSSRELFAINAPIGNIPGSPGDAVGFAVSNAGTIGVLALHDGRLFFVDMANGQVIREGKVKPLSMNYNLGQLGRNSEKSYPVERVGGNFIPAFDRVVQFTPDDKRLVVMYEGNYSENEYLSDILVYDVSSLGLLFRTKDLLFVNYPTGMSFSRDGNTLLTGGDRELLAFDIVSGRSIAKLELPDLGPTQDSRFSMFLGKRHFIYFGRVAEKLNMTEANDGQPISPPDTVIFSKFASDEAALLVTRLGEMIFWNVKTGTTEKLHRTDGRWALSADMQQTGPLVAIGYQDGRIGIFDSKEKKLLIELRGHTSEVQSLRFNKAGTHLVSIGGDGTARAWNVKQDQSLFVMGGHGVTDGVMSASIDEDSNSIITGHRNGAVRSWSFKAPFGGASRFGAFDDWSDLSFSHDGDQMLTTQGKLASVFQRDLLAKPTIFKGHTDRVLHARFNPQSSLVATTSLDGTVRIWDASTGLLRHTFETVQPKRKESITWADIKLNSITNWGVARAIVFSPSGAELLIGRNDGVAELREMGTGRLIWSMGPDGAASTPGFANPRKGIVAATFSKDGRHAVLGRLDGSIVIRTVDSNEVKFLVIKSDKRQTGEIRDFSLDGAGRLMAVAIASRPFDFRLETIGAGRTIYSNFDVSGGALLLDFTKLTLGEISYRGVGGFDPDVHWETKEEALEKMDLPINDKGYLEYSGREVAEGGERFGSDRVDAAAVHRLGEKLSTLGRHIGNVNGVRLVESGRALITWSDDSTIRVWNAEDGKLRSVHFGGGEAVKRVSVSPDEKTISAAASERILVWKVDAAEPAAEFATDGEAVGVAFSRDGQWLAAIEQEGDVYVWKNFSGSQELIEAAKKMMPRCLTGSERQQLALEITPPEWCVKSRKYPYRFGRIGVRLDNVSEEKRRNLGYNDAGGALITDVFGAPALAADLRVNDVVYQVSSRAVVSSSEFAAAIANSDIGSPVELHLWRDNRTIRLSVTPQAEE